jgi:hypothetical protein
MDRTELNQVGRISNVFGRSEKVDLVILLYPLCPVGLGGTSKSVRVIDPFSKSVLHSRDLNRIRPSFTVRHVPNIIKSTTIAQTYQISQSLSKRQ